MRKFSEQRFLADLYRKDAVQAVFLQSLVDGINNIAKGAGVAVSGDLPAPPPVNAINVKASGEMVHVTLTHAAEVSLECGAPFKPTREWQRFDRPACRYAYRRRVKPDREEVPHRGLLVIAAGARRAVKV